MAADHPEWDLSAYSRVDSDYWKAEASAEGGGTPIEAGAGSAEGSDATWETDGVGDQEALETTVGSGIEQIVQIVDDEPVA